MRLFKRNTKVFLTVGFAFLGMVSVSLRAADATTQKANLKVGAAKVDITPENLGGGFVLIGTRQVKGVHDRLYARAAVIGDGNGLAAIVSLDMVEYGDSLPLRQRIEKEAGISADHIILAATHDHSAPRGGPVTPGTSSAVEGRPWSNPDYIKQADDQIVEAVTKAKASMQPAHMAFATTHADVGYNFHLNYSTPGWGQSSDNDFPSDKTVWVVKFTNDGGDPIAILMNVSVHSNAEASSGDGMISADVAGVAEAYVEHQYKDKVVALWTMGACADVYPRLSARSDQSGDPDSLYTAQKLLGGVVGSAVAEVVNKIKQSATVSNVVMKAYERAIPCELNINSGAPSGGQSRQDGPGGPGGAGGPSGPGGPNAQGGPGGPGQPGGPGGQQSQPNLNIPKIPIQPGEKLDIHVSLIRLNQLAIAGVSGELSTNLYANLKKVMPYANTMMITLANNRDGYIPDEANWDHWGNAAFVKGCAETAITNNLVDIMNLSLQ